MNTPLTTVEDPQPAPPRAGRLRRLLGGLVGGVWRGDRPLYALFQTVGTQGLVLVANLVTGIITARLLGPEGRGEYAAVSVWPQLLAMLAMAGMQSAIVFRMRTAPADARATAGAALVCGTLLALSLAALGFFVLPVFMHQYPPALVLFAQLCLVSVLVNVVHMVMKQSFAGAAQFARANFANLLPQALFVPALLLLLPLGAMHSRGAVLALLGSGFVAVLLLAPGFFRHVRPTLAGAAAQVPPLARYSARAWVGELVTSLATYADRLVLVPLLPAAQLGLYAVAFSFSRLLQIVQPAILSVFFSHLAARDADAAKTLHDRALRVLVVLLPLACAVLWLAGEPLLVLTFGPEFAAANLIFRLLIVEAAFGVLAQVTMQLLLSRDRPGFVSALQSVMLALSLAALLLLVPKFGAIGAALALAAAGLVRWIALLVAIPTVLKLPRPRFLLDREDIQFMLRRLR